MPKRRLLSALLAVVWLLPVALCGCQKDGINEVSQDHAPGVELPAEEADVTEESEKEPEPVPEKIEVIQQTKAEYEQWLASAMILGLSMEYPDFELISIHAASTTTLEEKKMSQGVCVLFQSEGTQRAVVSKPLTGERKGAGTRDLSSVTIGFATFDEVDPAVLVLENMIQLQLEDLNETMSQSVLVSIYNH